MVAGRKLTTLRRSKRLPRTELLAVCRPSCDNSSMKKPNFPSLLLAVAAVFMLCGCMTPITVQTDPPGATVYCRGWGRPAYKWKSRGITAADKPVTFRVPYNTIHTVAIWPGKDGKPASRSPEVETKLLFREDPVIVLKPIAQ